MINKQIFSQYSSLHSIFDKKEFNTELLKIHKADFPESKLSIAKLIAKEIRDNKRESYLYYLREAENSVPGSETHVEAKRQCKRIKTLNRILKGLSFKCDNIHYRDLSNRYQAGHYMRGEDILIEEYNYPSKNDGDISMDITKVHLKMNVSNNHKGYYDYDDHWVSEPYTTTEENVDVFFYCNSNTGEVILDPVKEYYLEYTHEDLISMHTMYSEQRTKTAITSFAHDCGLSYSELKDMIGRQCDVTNSELHVKEENAEGEEVIVSYSKGQIIKLHKEFEEAKKKKYIRDDLYVEYPRYVNYLNFLKSLEKGVYQHIPSNNEVESE